MRIWRKVILTRGRFYKKLIAHVNKRFRSSFFNEESRRGQLMERGAIERTQRRIQRFSNKEKQIKYRLSDAK